MSGQTTLAFWQLLLLTFLPASLTALVALLGPQLLEGRKSRAESVRRRHEKLEEVIGAIHDHEHWLDVKRTTVIWQHDLKGDSPPISKVRMIIELYFPQFKNELQAYKSGSMGYEGWMYSAAQQTLKEPTKMPDGHREVYGPFIEAQANLLDALHRYGEAELHPKVNRQWIKLQKSLRA